MLKTGAQTNSAPAALPTARFAGAPSAPAHPGACPWHAHSSNAAETETFSRAPNLALDPWRPLLASMAGEHAPSEQHAPLKWLNLQACVTASRASTDLERIARGERARVLDMRRRVLTAVFTSACHDFSSVAERARRDLTTEAIVDTGALLTLRRPRGSGRPLFEVAKSMTRAKQLMVFRHEGYANPGEAALGVGEYGEPCARALAIAAIALCRATMGGPLGWPQTSSPGASSGALHVLGTELTFQGAIGAPKHWFAAAMHEGVVTTAQVVAMLMGRRQPGVSVSAALDACGRPTLQLATHAPFGVLVPAAVDGWVCQEPVGRDVHARPTVPPGLHELIERARDRAGDTPSHMTETLRGCPAAYAGPGVVDGKLKLLGPGLGVVIRAYLHTVQHVLHVMAGSSRPRSGQ